MKGNEIHIGELIKNIVREGNIKDADFAKKIGKSRQNVYDLYKRNDVEVKLLLTISRALDYDFFQHFRTTPTEDVPITDVCIQLKVQPEKLDSLFQWMSDNGNVNISKKKHRND
jgi:transcriptional regulator with XRE-family HTH domain